MDNKKIGFDIIKLSKLIKRTVELQINKSCKNNKMPELTSSSQWVIRFLYENKDKDIFQKDIEEHMSLRPSTVSANLKLMEKKGLIQREHVDYDTRLKKVSLTEETIKMEENVQDFIEDIENRLKKLYSDEELTVLYDLLERGINELDDDYK